MERRPYLNKLIEGNEERIREKAELLKSLTQAYFPDYRLSRAVFRPTRQVGYTCVPTSLHEVAKQVLGSGWPYKTVEEVQAAVSWVFSFPVDEKFWMNPSIINAVVNTLHDTKGIPAESAMCADPLTLTAVLKSGGMAVAKHKDEAHVYIIEDFNRVFRDQLSYVIGDTLTGTVKFEEPYDDMVSRFFNQDYAINGIIRAA